MRTVLRRGIALLVLLAFVVGGFVQLVPQAMAAQTCAMAMKTSSSDGDGGSKGMAPICVDSSGCIVPMAIAGPIAPDFVTLAWAVIQYWSAAALLDGIVVEPHHSPPRSLA